MSTYQAPLPDMQLVVPEPAGAQAIAKLPGFEGGVVFEDVVSLESSIGRTLHSEWITIDQELIDDFARVSQDRQWIHIDSQRARRESPFGTTIAHGFLMLSLLVRLLADAASLPNMRLTINYGFDRVRFISPVPVESIVRAAFALERVSRNGDSVNVTWNVTVEIRDSPKPALAALWLLRYML